MKPYFELHCPVCCRRALIMRRTADSPDYSLDCDECGARVATIPTYSIQFVDDKEDDHANPTE